MQRFKQSLLSRLSGLLKNARGQARPLAMWVACLGIFLIFLMTSPFLPAQEDASDASPDFVYDPPDEMVAAHVWEKPLRYDADVLAAKNKRYFAWLEFVPGRGDQIWLGESDHEEATEADTSRVAVSDFGDYARPTLTADANGQIWLTYEKRDDGQWDVFATPLVGSARPFPDPARVSVSKGADIRHSVAADPRGGIWIAWQSDIEDQFEIVVGHLPPSPEASMVRFTVSENPYNDWHPRIAVAPDGRLVVAWDGFNGRDHDVYVRCRKPAETQAEGDGGSAGSAWLPTQVVANSEAFEGRPDVAFDGDGTAWIAWEQGGTNWGRPFRGLLTPAIGDAIGPLHRFRILNVGILDESGRVRLLEQPLPLPSQAAALERRSSRPSKTTGVFYERPRLGGDSHGRMWIAYRHFYAPWLGYEHRSHVETGWGLYARCFADNQWSPLYQFRVGQGDGMQRMEWSAAPGGMQAIWTTGRTDRRRHNRPRGLVVGQLMSDLASHLEDEASPRTKATKSSPAARLQRTRPSRPRFTMAGQEYRLFFGDLHRHTDLSLCRVPIDGTIDDAYRYASDVAELDFLGITDHSRDIALGNPLSQLWWRSRKEVLRYQQGDRFLPMFAYERSHGNTADHNVISLRDDRLRPHTYPVPEFWKELDRDTITIPHQPIRRDTWKYQDDALRPLVEIFQGARDASIEEHVHRGLAKGYHLGFIASSDHMSTSASYACVWAEDSDRESIFRALQARRTYGATAKIVLRLKAGPHKMGEQVEDTELPPLELDAQGTAPIRSVTVVVDGKPYKEFSPDRQKVQMEIPIAGAATKDRGPQKRGSKQTQHYVYVHLRQADGNEAWSSPIWWKADSTAE